MYIGFYVLHSFMKYWVFSKCNGTLVVTSYYRDLTELNFNSERSDFIQQISAAP